MSGECDDCGNHCLECECNELVRTLQLIARILDNVQYECSSRVYTLDDDEMGWVYHCRDIAQIAIREHRSNFLFKQNVKNSTDQDQ